MPSHPMSRTIFLALAPAFLAATAFAHEDRPPNVIYLFADDLGYGDLGSYGQEKIATPNFDRLAEEGMRFTQHYAGAPLCAPSRATLMTGRHTGHTHVRALGDHPMRADEPSLAMVFKNAGYATAAFGKWGLGLAGTSGAPTAKGFDEFFGYLDHKTAHFYYPPSLTENDREVALPENAEGKRGTYSHDLFAERALDFVRRNEDRPFFLYLPFTIPHAEVLVPEDSLAEYRGRWPETPFEGKPGGYHSQPEPRAARAAMISRMDRDLGRLLDLLDELDLADHTLVMISSDNGPITAGGQDVDFFDSNGPLRDLKFTLWEGGIRVPFIARWSGSIPPGTVSDFVCATWDMLPTMAELLEVEAPDDIDGVSILPTLLGRTDAQAARPPLYWEHQGKQAIRRGEWKAIRPKFGATTELYDLREDPSETTNRAAENPELVAELEALMAASRTESELFPLKPR